VARVLNVEVPLRGGEFLRYVSDYQLFLYSIETSAVTPAVANTKRNGGDTFCPVQYSKSEF
jgi:hypothetical protein